MKKTTAGLAALALTADGIIGTTTALAADGTCQVYSGGGWLVGACPEPAAVPVERIGGANKYETAVLISQINAEPGVPAVYLANAASMVDALSISPYTDGPILLVPATGTLPTTVAGELARLNPGKLVVLGGTTAVSNDMLGQAQLAAAK